MNEGFYTQLFSEELKQARGDYENGSIDSTSLDSAVDNFIRENARKDYNRILNRKDKSKSSYSFSMGNLLMPEGIFYAMQNGEFDKEEIKNINSCFKEMHANPSSYKKGNLQSIIKEELLNPTTMEMPLGKPTCTKCID